MIDRSVKTDRDRLIERQRDGCKIKKSDRERERKRDTAAQYTDRHKQTNREKKGKRETRSDL